MRIKPEPTFRLTVLPFGVFNIPTCSKACWDKLCESLDLNDGAGLTEVLKGLIPKLPESTPMSIKQRIGTDYREKVEEYCEQLKDLYEVPSKVDFEHDDKPIKLPITTYGESIVKDHTGFNFDEIDKLSVLEYRMLLADAVKLRILRRSDGKGAEYLQECYNSMHQISTLWD